MKKIILMMLILLIPLVYAIDYTPSTETNCENGVCNKVLYSGIKFVNEDKVWKRIEEARSLKGSGIECIVESDNIHLVECLDYNYTYRKLRMSINPLSVINKENIPIKIMKRDFDGSLIEKSRTIEDLTLEKEKWIKAELGEEIYIGDKSTTIMLQEANTENLGDTYINNASVNTNYGSGITSRITYDTGDYRTLYTWNTTTITDAIGVDIQDSNLYIYDATNYLDDDTEGYNISSHHLYNNFSWSESIITWTTRPQDGDYNTTFTDTNYFFGGAGEPNGWITWNVTQILRGAINYPNTSMLLKGHDTFGTPNFDHQNIVTKEHPTTNLRPYLNITYIIIDTVSPTITVTSPEAKTYGLTKTNITIDFTAVDNVGGDGLDSLWFFNGTDNTSYSDGTPQYNNLSNGGYTYIFYANDTAGNLASESITFTVAYDVERKLQAWRNTVTQSDVAYINSTGDISMGFSLVFANLEEIHNTVDGWIEIEGNLKVDGDTTTDYLKLIANSSLMTCDNDNCGGLYYNNGTNKHYGCNCTDWNSLY